MADLKVIATFSHAHQAHLVKAKLEASEIPVYLADENTVSMNWLYSNAVGGVKLQVPEEFAEQALDVLKADFSADLEDGAVVEKICLQCQSKNIEHYTKNKSSALVTVFFFGLPLIFCKHGLKCSDCGHFWQPK